MIQHISLKNSCELKKDVKRSSNLKFSYTATGSRGRLLTAYYAKPSASRLIINFRGKTTADYLVSRRLPVSFSDFIAFASSSDGAMDLDFNYFIWKTLQVLGVIMMLKKLKYFLIRYCIVNIISRMSFLGFWKF